MTREEAVELVLCMGPIDCLRNCARCMGLGDEMSFYPGQIQERCRVCGGSGFLYQTKYLDACHLLGISPPRTIPEIVAEWVKREEGRAACAKG